MAEVGGLSFRKFRVEAATAASSASIVEEISGGNLTAAGDSFTMENALVSAKFSSKTGFLQASTDERASGIHEQPFSVDNQQIRFQGNSNAH